jgi:hypothetical protein
MSSKVFIKNKIFALAYNFFFITKGGVRDDVRSENHAKNL